VRNWGMGDFTDLQSLIELAQISWRQRRRAQSPSRAVDYGPGRLVSPYSP